MKRLLKGLRRDKRGFTLIELLIVVGILGILAGVVTLGVSQFIGKGETEAQNTELHNVQTAVTALMADNALAALTAAGAVGPGDTVVNAGEDIGPYLVTGLKWTYDVAVDGHVTPQ